MIALYRIDDRLVHGQVVLGWGQALRASFIVLVDDAVARAMWEQELYRLGVPPEIDLYFAGVDEAVRRHDEWVADARTGILLTPDIGTMDRLIAAVRGIGTVNLGGLHHRPGREQKLRYVFLTAEEETQLRSLEELGVNVTAQDLPTARPVPIDELLGRRAGR